MHVARDAASGVSTGARVSESRSFVLSVRLSMRLSSIIMIRALLWPCEGVATPGISRRTAVGAQEHHRPGGHNLMTHHPKQNLCTHPLNLSITFTTTLTVQPFDSVLRSCEGHQWNL